MNVLIPLFYEFPGNDTQERQTAGADCACAALSCSGNDKNKFTALQ